MKTVKLVIGIISIVLSVVILFQSLAVGVGNTLTRNGEVSGSAGFFVAIFMLIAGIVGIVTKNGGRAGAITNIILYTLAFFMGIGNLGSYADLFLWSMLCLFFATYYTISELIIEKEQKAIKIIGLIIAVVLFVRFFVVAMDRAKEADIFSKARASLNTHQTSNNNSSSNKNNSSNNNNSTFGDVFSNNLEKSRESADLANLRAAKAAAITAYLDGKLNGKELKNGDVYWYNPDTGHLIETFVVAGRGTDEKVSDADYSDSSYVEVHYDGRDVTEKGIRVTFVDISEKSEKPVEIEFVSPEWFIANK